MLIEEISVIKNIDKKEAFQCLKKSIKCARKLAIEDGAFGKFEILGA